MLTLYHFGPIWGLPDGSPFCVKLETYLRMTGIPYQSKYVSDPRKAPKGKLPFIQDGDHKIADSTLAIDYLKQKYGDTLDAHLSLLEQAQATAFQALLEEHLYWILVYTRWCEPAGWAIVKEAFFAKLPWFLKTFVPAQIQKKIKKDLHAQGVGRHTREDIDSMGKKDILAISVFLADKPFFFGDKPTSMDAIAFGFLCVILGGPVESELKTYTQSLKNLPDYCERMKGKFYE